MTSFLMHYRRISVLSHAMSWQQEGSRSGIVNTVDQMALDAYKPGLIEEFLPTNMDRQHAEHIVGWLKDHHKRTLEPILKVLLRSGLKCRILDAVSRGQCVVAGV